MKDVLRRLIEYGLDPIQAIRCATLNASIRIRRNDLGLLAAGRTADIVVLSDLRGVVVDDVFVSGQRATQGGKLILTAVSTVEPPAYEMKVSPLTADDCRIRVPGVTSGRAKTRTIEGVRFPSWGEKEVEVKDGFAVIPEGHSVLLMVHRHGKITATPQTALMAGWGELHGAVATTYSHDSHNLAVLGCDPKDMCAAANALIACGGGIAVAKDGEVIAKVELPIAGVLSMESGDAMAAAFASVKEAAGKVIEWHPPYRTFKALTATSLACNPGPHLTDLGLTDGSTGEIVAMVVARS
jgi:adenine deaminase